MHTKADYAFRITDDGPYIGFGDFTVDSYSPSFEATITNDGSVAEGGPLEAGLRA